MSVEHKINKNHDVHKCGVIAFHASINKFDPIDRDRREVERSSRGCSSSLPDRASVTRKRVSEVDRVSPKVLGTCVVHILSLYGENKAKIRVKL